MSGYSTLEIVPRETNPTKRGDLFDLQLHSLFCEGGWRASDSGVQLFPKDELFYSRVLYLAADQIWMWS